MTIVLASLLTATALLGAWTLAILKVKRQLEDAAAIRRRLARGQDSSGRCVQPNARPRGRGRKKAGAAIWKPWRVIGGYA